MVRGTELGAQLWAGPTWPNGRTTCSTVLDEPTDNLDLAVTHDRWFTRRVDRFVVFGDDGQVRETPEPVGEVARTH